MSSNPLHGLIATLGRFTDAVRECHDAVTDEKRKQTRDAWLTERSWFWPRFRFLSEAIRGLADPALAWCAQREFSAREHVTTIETAVQCITELVMLYAPCAYPDLYSNKEEAWEIWERQGDLLMKAIHANDALRRLAALTGEAWQSDDRPAVSEQGEGTAGDNGPAGAEKAGKKNKSKKQLKPCHVKAYRQFQYAMEQKPGLETDRDVYEWLHEYADTEGELPPIAAWKRYLGNARAYHNNHKHAPRKGRATSKSIVRPDQI